MISPKQDRLYWFLWSRAWCELARAHKTLVPDEENKRRHELHVRALGYDKSHRDFSNRELDYVLSQFRAISDPFGTVHLPQQTVRDSRRRRLYFALRSVMRRLDLSEEYVQGISQRMFLGLEVRQLAADELQKLLIALKKHEQRSVV